MQGIYFVGYNLLTLYILIYTMPVDIVGLSEFLPVQQPPYYV